MFRVRWEETALNELTALWTEAPSTLRATITTVTAQIDQILKTEPLQQSESRPGGKRILFAAPLGIIFRLEADRQTVSVLRVWFFRKRGQ